MSWQFCIISALMIHPHFTFHFTFFSKLGAGMCIDSERQNRGKSQGLFWPPLEFVRTQNTEPHTEHTFRVCKNTCIVRRKTETWHPGLMELYTDTIQGFDQSKPFLLPNAMQWRKNLTRALCPVQVIQIVLHEI